MESQTDIQLEGIAMRQKCVDLLTDAPLKTDLFGLIVNPIISAGLIPLLFDPVKYIFDQDQLLWPEYCFYRQIKKKIHLGWGENEYQLRSFGLCTPSQSKKITLSVRNDQSNMFANEYLAFLPNNRITINRAVYSGTLRAGTSLHSEPVKESIELMAYRNALISIESILKSG